jgi:hypothetical protein
MSALSYTLLPNRVYYLPQQWAHQQNVLSHPYQQQRSSIVANIIEDHQREQRIKFLLFVKVLFKRLRDSRDVYLLARAQLLVKAVTRRNKMGDPNFHPLLESMERRLRELVGELHWRQTHAYMRYYIHKHGDPSKVTVTAPATKRPLKEQDYHSSSSASL